MLTEDKIFDIYKAGEIMRKSLIFLSIFIVSFIALWDMKDRLNELDSIAVKTPSQVEMKPMIQKFGERAEKDDFQKRNTPKQFEGDYENEQSKKFKNPVTNTNRNPAPVDNRYR